MRCIVALSVIVAAAATPLRAADDGEHPAARVCRDAAEAEPVRRRDLGRCDRAIRAAGLPPPVRLAMVMNRGIARLKAGLVDGAVDDFDLAVRAAPGLAEAWINKGMALARLPGRAAEAAALITHGIDIGPREPARALFARAQALEAAGRLREAMEDYGAAARADPEWPAPAEELKRFRVERRRVLRG